MRHILPALRFKIFMILALGLIYPAFVAVVGQIFFAKKAAGSLVYRGEQLVGSELIGQKFESAKYFWPRPSAVDYNTLASGGSNLGQASQDLKKAVEERRAKLKAAHADQIGEPPQDLLFASGSGLDPHVSLEAARYQEARVANSRGLSPDKIHNLVSRLYAPKPFRILGEGTVNILALNLALDQLAAEKAGAAPETEPK